MGENPAQNLQAVREVNRRAESQALPRSFGELSLTRYNITNGSDGQPSEFNDRSGRWRRSEGNGDTWVNAADSDHPRFKRGTPSIDSAGNLRFQNSDFGTTETNFANGASRIEMTSADGKRFAVERDRNGRASRLEDHTGSWTSNDGKTWRDDKGNTKQGEPSISAAGEYTFKESGKPAFKAASAALSEALKLQQKISETYGVTITAADTAHKYGVTSQPSARELRALDEVLDKSKHVDLKGLKISFLGEKPRGIEQEYGDYSDKQLNIFQNARVNPEGWLGIKGVGLHEIVHLEQDAMSSEFWRGRNPGKEVSSLRTALGWDYHQKFGPVLLDKQGGMWSPRGERDDKEVGPKTNWVWVAGTPPEGNKQIISADEMERRALIKPATPYNNHPYESHADSVALFRSAPELLAAKSPSIYRAMRDWDQQKLDSAYPPGEMMRDVDGRIVRSNAESWQRRLEMERRYGL